MAKGRPSATKMSLDVILELWLLTHAPEKPNCTKMNGSGCDNFVSDSLWTEQNQQHQYFLSRKGLNDGSMCSPSMSPKPGHARVIPCCSLGWGGGGMGGGRRKGGV